jgi:phage/plasmid-like protein (TIGR03299 family)
MSQQSYRWLAENVLAGFAETRRPWWADAAEREGWATNLFPAEVPMERVEELLTSWSPYSEPLYTGDMEEVTTHKLIRASDNRQQIAVVGADYEIHAYRDWLTGTVQECVGDDAQISSAGLLRNRAQAWVQIERPETSTGPGGIRFSPYIMLSTSLDMSLASQTNQNTRMVICDNTMQIGRNQGLAFRAKHTKGSSAKLGDQRSVMMRLLEGESDFREELERQLAVEVSDTAFSRFLESFVPINDDDIPAKKTRSERKRQEITQLYRADERVMPWKGTEFGVVQAVNTWQQHLSQLRNATPWEMDDTNLRAMRNYGENLRGNQGRDMETVRVLEAVLV